MKGMENMNTRIINERDLYKNDDFIEDEEKMYDFVRLTKEEFLLSYSYLTEEEYDNTMKIYKSRKEDM
jgi:hypothetical protein